MLIAYRSGLISRSLWLHALRAPARTDCPSGARLASDGIERAAVRHGRSVRPRRSQQLAQSWCQPRRQHWRVPSNDRERGRVDARSWPERSSVDGRPQVKLPPRCPRCGAQRRRRPTAVLHRDLELHDQVDAIWTTVGGVQESGEDLGREPEGWVRDDTKRCRWQAQSTEICLDDARSAVGAPRLHDLAQPLGPDGVALHRPHLDACAEQRKRQRTRAGAELDDDVAGAQVE